MLPKDFDYRMAKRLLTAKQWPDSKRDLEAGFLDSSTIYSLAL